MIRGHGLRLLPQALALALAVLVGSHLLAYALGEGTAVARQVLSLAYVVIVVLALLFHRVTLAAARAAPILVALLLVVCASVLWSVDPGQTMRRLLAIVSCTLLGMLIGHALSLRGLILLFGVLGVLVAVASLISIGLFPAARGAPPWDGVWRGIFSHKNGLGAACAITLPFVLYSAWITRNPARGVFIIGALLLLGLLAASESRTSQLIGVIAVASLATALFLRHALLTWATILTGIFLLTLVVVPILLATGAAASFFEAIGRQPTMSGRLPIWQLVWPWIEERPILGYGYAAFWAPGARHVFQIANDPTMHYVPYYSHNGLIETLLDVGLVGVSLVVVVLIQAGAAVFRVLAVRPRTPDVAPLLIFLIAFCLVNISEAIILQRENLIWIMATAVIVRLLSLGRALRRGASRPTAHAPSRPAVPSGPAH